MHKKTIFTTFFILATIILTSIALLSVSVLVIDFYDLLSHNPEVFVCNCEDIEAMILNSIFLFTVILCVDILLLFILFLLFKKTRTKMETQKISILINKYNANYLQTVLLFLISIFKSTFINNPV